MGSELQEQDIFDVLNRVQDPELNHSLVELGIIQCVDIDGGLVEVEIQLTSPSCPFAAQIVQSIKDAVRSLDGVDEVEVKWACLSDG